MSTFRLRIQEGRPQRIVAFGSSLTSEWNWRVWRRCGGHWVRLLRANLDARYRGLARITNAACWGADSAWAVRRVVVLTRSLPADVAFVEFAVNDADVSRGISLLDSRRNLVQVLRVMQANWPACEIHLLVTNPVFGRHEANRPRLRDYYDIVRRVASDSNVSLIDTMPAWQRALTKRDWRELLRDGIHPGEEAARSIILPQLWLALDL